MLEKTESLGQDIGLTFSSAFEDAIVGSKKFSVVLKSLGDDILKAMARKNITEPPICGISRLFSGGDGGFISAIGDLFSGLFADGGYHQ